MKSWMDTLGGKFPLESQGSFVLFTLLVTLVVILFVRFLFLTRWTKRAQNLNEFPGGPIIPFVGNAGVYFGKHRDIQKRLTEYMKQYGKTVRLWSLDQPRIITIEPKLIEKIANSTNFLDKADEYRFLSKFVGDGLATSSGKQWKQDRNILNRGFGYNQFDEFINCFNSGALTLMEVLDEVVQNSEQPLNLLPIFCLLVLENVTRSTLGSRMNMQRTSDNSYIEAMQTVSSGISKLFLKPWLSLPIIRTIFGNDLAEQKALKLGLHTNLQIIKERGKLLAEKRDKKEEDEAKPLIDIMLESHISQNEKNLNDQILSFMGGGTDSTSRVLNSTLFFLAANPNCQDKVHEEIDRVFDNDCNQLVTLSHTAELKYMEMCIKEAMRIIPPFPFFARKSHSDFQLDDGRIIPEGCGVFVSIFGVHHDPDLYPEPEMFDPERFSKDACINRNQYAYIPFSAGPRNCIAWKFAFKELQVTLVYILRKYKVGTRQKLEDLKYMPGIPSNVYPNIELFLKLR